MAEKLIESMADEWKPGNYKDELRSRLPQAIQRRLKAKGVVKTLDTDDNLPTNSATNVVECMSLLQKSIASDKRTPAKRKLEKVIEDTAGARRKKAPQKKSTPKKKRVEEASMSGSAAPAIHLY